MYGYGTVYKLTTNAVFTTIYSFTAGDDGYNPNALVQGKDGNFYGTTSDGGIELRRHSLQNDAVRHAHHPGFVQLR